MEYPRVVIAGIRGGAGKTTLSLSLITAFRKLKGLKVIPFKKGPDYIDAGWMSFASGNPCYNLDPFLIPKDKILQSFVCHSTGDISVIEGNRGLYDGMDAGGAYSTAEVAKLLKAPVVLVLDCSKMTRTAAAVVLGCMRMDTDVLIRGVILNQIAGSRHEAVIRESIERYCNLPVLGAIPRMAGGEFPERHLGLTPYQEHANVAGALSFVEEIGKKYLDSDAVISLAREAEQIQNTFYAGEQSRTQGWVLPRPRIGVIRDTAFQFYYPENIEELEKRGAEIIEVNAVLDKTLPDIDTLYIGGGFPETHAIDLAVNSSFRDSVRTAAETGLPIYAECGGLMFLGNAIIHDGKEYPMVGLFPLNFEMRNNPEAHGYTIMEADHENPFYPKGTVLHGHEFHYSAVVDQRKEDSPYNSQVYTAFRMKRGQGIFGGRDGICYKNVFATYTHLHALGSVAWADGIIRNASQFSGMKRTGKE